VTGEDLPWLFAYVVLQADSTDLFAHLKLMNQFSTTSMRLNALGFNAANFEISLEMLLELTQE
jgi:hypothetical protein